MIWVQLALGLIAAGATVVAAWYAREAAKVGGAAVVAAQTTIDLTKQAVGAARDTIAIAERSHREDERDRRRRRLERIGELVEEVFLEAHPETATHPQGWVAPRNRLRQALVGFQGPMPLCVDVVNSSPAQMFGAASRARGEVEVALTNLEDTHE
jgi:hypothetical protein